MNKFLVLLIIALISYIINSLCIKYLGWPDITLVQQLLYVATGALIVKVGKPKRYLKIRIKYQDGTVENLVVDSTTHPQVEFRGKTSKVTEFNTINEFKIYKLMNGWVCIKTHAWD
jgi:hypothetical protein